MQMGSQCDDCWSSHILSAMDHKLFKLKFCTGDLNHIDMRLPTHT